MFSLLPFVKLLLCRHHHRRVLICRHARKQRRLASKWAALLAPQDVPIRIEEAESWAIQVGSFSRRVNAHKAAIDARRNAAKVLRLVPAELSVVMSGEMPLWRVRFGNLEETEARAACAALFSSGKACIALPIALNKDA